MSLTSSIKSLGSVKSMNSTKSSSSTIAVWRLAAKSVVRQSEKLHYLSLLWHMHHHHLHHNHIIINIFIISFVVIFNCLYINPLLLFFVHSPPHPSAGGDEQVRGYVVLSAGCCVKPHCLLSQARTYLLQNFYNLSSLHCKTELRSPSFFLSIPWDIAFLSNVPSQKSKSSCFAGEREQPYQA